MFENNSAIENDLKNKDCKNLAEHTQEKIDNIRLLTKKDDIESALKEINALKAQLSYWVKTEHEKPNISFILGRFIGTIESMEVFLKETQKMKYILQALPGIPHANTIINVLYQETKTAGHGCIRHETLAEKTNIDSYKLEEIMYKLIDINIVTSTRPGKYKYYYLTEYGEKYYKNKEQ